MLDALGKGCISYLLLSLLLLFWRQLLLRKRSCFWSVCRHWVLAPWRCSVIQNPTGHHGESERHALEPRRLVLGVEYRSEPL